MTIELTENEAIKIKKILTPLYSYLSVEDRDTIAILCMLLDRAIDKNNTSAV